MFDVFSTLPLVDIVRHPYSGSVENADGDIVSTFGDDIIVGVYGWAPASDVADGTPPRPFEYEKMIDVYGPVDMDFRPFDEATVDGVRYRCCGGTEIWVGPVKLNGARIRLEATDG